MPGHTSSFRAAEIPFSARFIRLWFVGNSIRFLFSPWNFYIHSSAQQFISSGLLWLDMCGSPHTSRSFTSESTTTTTRRRKKRNRKFNGFFLSPHQHRFHSAGIEDNDSALRRIKRMKMLKIELKLKTKANLCLLLVKRKVHSTQSLAGTCIA